MLDDKDRIFTNLYGMHDRSLAGARARGHWDGTAEITLEIVAAFGARIPAVAEKVQENVKSAVQNMTNVTVSRVDLVIAGLAPAAEPQA